MFRAGGIFFSIRNLRGMWTPGSGVGILFGRIGKCLIALECWELGRFLRFFLGKRKEYRCRVFKNLMSFCKGHGVNARDRRASKLSSASIQEHFDSSMAASHLDFIKSYFSNPEIIL